MCHAEEMDLEWYVSFDAQCIVLFSYQGIHLVSWSFGIDWSLVSP